jgi:hypothetical protein
MNKTSIVKLVFLGLALVGMVLPWWSMGGSGSVGSFNFSGSIGGINGFSFDAPGIGVWEIFIFLSLILSIVFIFVDNLKKVDFIPMILLLVLTIVVFSKLSGSQVSFGSSSSSFSSNIGIGLYLMIVSSISVLITSVYEKYAPSDSSLHRKLS